jgi:hypothetical protein
MELAGSMKQRIRTIVFAVSLVSALAVGAVVGAWFAIDTVRGSRSLAGEMGASEWYNAHIFAERNIADPTAYRQALLDYLTYLQSRRNGDGVLINDHVVAVDTVLTETRLALLADSQRNESESKLYFARAIEHCAGAWKTGCTVERLQEIVSRLDRKVSN